MSNVDELAAKVEAKREAWALEPEAAGDYERLECGLVLYKPTLAHVWALARAAHVLEGDFYGLNLVTAWLLAHDSETVRHELMPLLRKGSDVVSAKAEDFLAGCGARPEELMPVVAHLVEEAFGPKQAAPQTGTET